jgi:hypothetical protein
MTILRVLACVAPLMLLSGDVIAQQFSAKEIVLKEATINMPANVQQWKMEQGSKAERPTQVLLQFSSDKGANDIQRLSENGIYIQNYIAPNVYSAIIDGQTATSFIIQSGIRSIVNVNPEWKTTQFLREKAAQSSGKIDIIVSVVEDVPAIDVQNFVESLGGSIIKGSLPVLQTYKMQIPAAKLNELAKWYGILYISPLSEDHELDVETKDATKANIVTYSGSGGLALTGKGVAIGIGDNTTGSYHVDLKDRTINYNPTPYTNHGVHISGIVGGAGLIDPKAEGHAPHATLINHLFSSVWEQTPAMVQAHNMTITNNSYAALVGNCKYAGTYDVNSVAIDKMALVHDEVLHVFAAGNDGYLDCPPFPQGFATINGGYQPAKNNIVVTSTNKAYVNAKDGGRGPVKDGRLKPEMTAVGVDVFSTTKEEGYLVAGGTSMACPEVAGALGLITERYRQIKGNSNPKAVLLKALLLNGTFDIGNPGPDYRFGFGFMDVSRTVDMLNKEQYKLSTIGNGNTESITVTVPANTAQLKVMLCWHDQPGNPAVANQLVNDLDLEVVEPSLVAHKPLILDATPSNILNNAVEGEDHKNNSEQVTVYNPPAGNYIINVKGFNIPFGSQVYALAYDFVPAGITITFPYNESKVKAGDSMYVYWSNPDRDNAQGKTFKLEYSTDDGQNWTLINDNIEASAKTHTWFVPAGINSGVCRMRISRAITGETHTTERFIINNQPVARLSDVQCPGYIRFNWAPIPGASAYRVYRKVGPHMEDIALTTDTTYTFSGLARDSFYYVAVAPVIQGMTGYRSLGVKRKPFDGNCQGNISDNDLAIERVLSPGSGRLFTSTELTTNEGLEIELKNLDDVINNYYHISYSVNNAAWQAKVYNTPIPGTSANIFELSTLDMSAPGIYSIKIAVENLLAPDPVKANDTISVSVRQIVNDPIDVDAGFSDDFETMAIVNTYTDSIGISTNGHWDYENTDSGHLRSYVNPGITLEGQRSISLDAAKNLAGGDNRNDLLGTFNLGQYNAQTDEIRMEFEYIMHGIPVNKIGNELAIRGNDTAEWHTIYYYNTGNAVVGKLQHSGTLSITDGLQKAIQNFSTSFQLRFSQRDTTVIAAKDYGTGTTIDNVRFYTVQNDMQLLGIVSPQQKECGISNQAPLVVNIRNGVNQAQNDIRLSYKLDNNPVVSETINTLGGKQQLTYTFAQRLDLSAPGAHILDVWLENNGDTYKKNDSILRYVIHNQPLISSFPYSENFENNDGYWFTEGLNNSWEYGTPTSPKINTAASGSKAWKTNLDGEYNNNEFSYLYSPCFNIKGLYSPAFKCKIAMDIENCGMVICDVAFMEFSFDGMKWERLGAPNQGVNWYNDSAYVWTEQDKTNWREAMIPLPKGNTIRLRFAFISDPGASFEGLAIDDAEIYDQRSFTNNQVISVSPNPTSDGKLNIEWASIGKPELKIVMTDITGRVVYNTAINGITGYNQSTIQTPYFSSGMYFMRIYIGNDKMEHKIVYK